MVDLAKACANLSKLIGLFNDAKKDYVFWLANDSILPLQKYLPMNI
jgi:hypothetical protein